MTEVSDIRHIDEMAREGDPNAEEFIRKLGMQLSDEHKVALMNFVNTETNWYSVEWHRLRRESEKAGQVLAAFYEKFPNLRPAYGYDRDVAPNGLLAAEVNGGDAS